MNRPAVILHTAPRTLPFPRPRRPGGRPGAAVGLAVLALLAAGQPGLATPQFARGTGLNCVACHLVPPKLNERGEAFLARGYRSEGGTDAGVKSFFSTVPLAAWVTVRHEEQLSRDFSETFLPKVELISGGPLGRLPFSYFLEWRIVSLQTRNDGSLLDRGGRFEDAYLNWEIHNRHLVRVGQFRALNQYDVSRRLSVSEPAVFSASLAGETTANRRIQSLRAFSPAGRSPGISYSFQSIEGSSASDGLFHFLTVPLVGELSLPLNEEARREASFELDGPPKGIFLETFYRRGLNSIGLHGFIGDERWLLTGVGMAAYGDFNATAAAGVDDRERARARGRYSFEVEYLPRWREALRGGAGFRVEYLSHANGEPAYIPYLVLSGPNTKFTFLLQVEYRVQKGSEAVFLDLSALF